MTRWPHHPRPSQAAILAAKSSDTRRIEIYSGRPLRVIKNKYNDEWAAREADMKELLAKGIVPVQHEIAEGRLKKGFFGGPPPTKEGFWNDIRGRDEEVALGRGRFEPPLVRFIPDSRTDSVPPFLNRPCEKT